jgi:hypothetical protein
MRTFIPQAKFTTFHPYRRESTTVSDISTLIVSFKAQLDMSGEPQFLFLYLVELTNGEGADNFHKVFVANCLKWHGFDIQYQQKMFRVYVRRHQCLTEKKSGVIELLVKDFPNVITWHCLNHRLQDCYPIL